MSKEPRPQGEDRDVAVKVKHFDFRRTARSTFFPPHTIFVLLDAETTHNRVRTRRTLSRMRCGAGEGTLLKGSAHSVMRLVRRIPFRCRNGSTCRWRSCRKSPARIPPTTQAGCVLLLTMGCYCWCRVGMSHYLARRNTASVSCIYYGPDRNLSVT